MTTQFPLKYKGIEYTVILDTSDWEKLKQYRWSITDCSRHRTLKLYVRRRERIDGKEKTIYMHREIACPPDDMVVDHDNGNGLDNRRDNFKLVPQEVNAAKYRQRKQGAW